MGLPTSDRDSVIQLADTDTSLALDIARQIADPWYRCQALAAVAVYLTSPRDRQQVLIDAFLSANLLDEPNRLVTVSSWPIKALAFCGDHIWMASETDRLLAIIVQEPSPVRRADALRHLLGATLPSLPSQHAVVHRVAIKFGNACREPLNTGRRNKKGDYLLEEVLPVISRLDAAFATELLEHLPASRAERARAAIESSRGTVIHHLLRTPNLRGLRPNSE